MHNLLQLKLLEVKMGDTVITYIGVGSNINPEENIIKALKLLKEKVTVCKSSTFYKTNISLRS